MIDLNVDRRGIRSSYELTRARCDAYQLATVTEIPTPTRVVVDERSGTLRACWAEVRL